MVMSGRAAVFLSSLYAGLSLLTATTAYGIITEPVYLDSEILKLSDGLPRLGMDGYKIRANKQWYGELYKMTFGIKKPNGQRVGLYLFRNALYSIVELAIIETAAFKDGKAETLIELAAVREIVKHDFDVKVEPFVESAKGFKKLIFMLIEESCKLRGRHTSFLLTWGKVEDNDRQLFHDKMRSFAELQEFFEDMMNFLNDLEHSCPKGRAQYEEMLRLYKEQKQQAAGKK